MRQYMVLAYDPVLKDTVVFVVQASDTTQLKKLVRDYYEKQGWSHGELTLQRKIIQISDSKPVQSFGHALERYQELESQVEHLCKKLFQAADWLESEGDTASFDEIHEFLKGFAPGQKLLDERYGINEELTS